jgi:hypothetical protein
MVKFTTIAVVFVCSVLDVNGFQVTHRLRTNSVLHQTTGFSTTQDGWWNAEKRTFYTPTDTENSIRVYPTYYTRKDSKPQLSDDAHEETATKRSVIPTIPISHQTDPKPKSETDSSNEADTGNRAYPSKKKIIPTTLISYAPPQTEKAMPTSTLSKAPPPPDLLIGQEDAALKEDDDSIASTTMRSADGWWNGEQQNFYEASQASEATPLEDDSSVRSMATNNSHVRVTTEEGWWNTEQTTFYSAAKSRKFKPYKVANPEYHRAPGSGYGIAKINSAAATENNARKYPSKKVIAATPVSYVSPSPIQKPKEDDSSATSIPPSKPQVRTITEEGWWNTEKTTFYSASKSRKFKPYKIANPEYHRASVENGLWGE